MEEKIIIKGARTHNLKNISLEIPRNKFVVFTGLSGSGKSSLAFDTIFAEGQRRYVESLSSYARQFLRQMQKPDVDEIRGLSPAISIDQTSRSNNPRSTVATITEIYDYLRVLFARIGKPHCMECGREIKRLSNEEIINLIVEKVNEEREGNSRVSPKAHPPSANRRNGLARASKKSVEFSVSIIAPVIKGRKGEYYQMLYDFLGKGYTKVWVDGEEKKLRERIVLDKNKKHDIEVVVDDISVSKDEAEKTLRERLSESVERALLEADGVVRVAYSNGESQLLSVRYTCPHDGFSFLEMEPRLFSFNSPYGACQACHGLGTEGFFGHEICSVCLGARLRPEALLVKVGSKNIVELSAMSTANAFSFFDELSLSAKDKGISAAVLREVENRLSFLLDVGLDYLALDRRANTLSGGEAQRIRLASQLGSKLVGALYVLDEPTIGLHQRDNERLIKTLKELRDLGNTIIVVEHDEDTIYASDYLVDIGPGAGIHGGHVVASDWTEKLLTAKRNSFKSLTVDYLRGEKEIAVPEKRRSANKGEIKIVGANIFNLKNVNIEVPLGRLVCLTGVSGSGKSTLMYEVIHKNLMARHDRRLRSAQTYNCAKFLGTEYAGRTILIDQSPIGRTPRSNPATYTGTWTHVRDLFAATEEARFRGWGPGRFSFNVKGGRCESCQGNGLIAVEMHFLPTVYVPCDVCRSKRFDRETLEVKYKGKDIYEILRLTVEEALDFFIDIPAIYDRLSTLSLVGLGYLELGQSATTLSGGEAQRVKISSELYRPHTERTIYLMDEPTIGLHYEDVKNFLEIVQKLVSKGNSVIMIEHNMDILKCADYLIDLGPEGGSGGGHLVAKGTPEEVANTPKSYTGKYLKKILAKKKL